MLSTSVTTPLLVATLFWRQNRVPGSFSFSLSNYLISSLDMRSFSFHHSITLSQFKHRTVTVCIPMRYGERFGAFARENMFMSVTSNCRYCHIDVRWHVSFESRDFTSMKQLRNIFILRLQWTLGKQQVSRHVRRVHWLVIGPRSPRRPPSQPRDQPSSCAQTAGLIGMPTSLTVIVR